jgi:hypothetical protein
MEALAELIENGQAKRIIVLCGAGISTGTCHDTVCLPFLMFCVMIDDWYRTIIKNRYDVKLSQNSSLFHLKNYDFIGCI